MKSRILALKFILLPLLICTFQRVASAGVSGQLRTQVDQYPQNLGPTTDNLVPYVSTDFGSKHKLSKKWRIQWKLNALTNPVSSGAPESFFFNVPEGFLEHKNAKLKIRLGMDTVNWAVVDVFSPSDIVDTTATFHPTRVSKLGAPMLHGFWGSEALNFEALYMPFQIRPMLPSRDSRWLPRRLLVNVDSAGEVIKRVILPNDVEYQYQRPETLDQALQNNYGLRISSHLGSLDLQVTHFEGASHTPNLRTDLVLDFGATLDEAIARSPIPLTTVTSRERTTAGGFVWAIGPVIFKGETAYEHVISSDPVLQAWSWSNVFAIETTLTTFGRNLTLLTQGYYTENPKANNNLISNSFRLFDRTGLIGGRLAFSDHLTVLASALYEMRTQGLFWTASLEQKLSDHLRFGLSWRDFSANRDGLLKTYDANDHFTLEMSYFF